MAHPSVKSGPRERRQLKESPCPVLRIHWGDLSFQSSLHLIDVDLVHLAPGSVRTWVRCTGTAQLICLSPLIQPLCTSRSPSLNKPRSSPSSTENASVGPAFLLNTFYGQSIMACAQPTFPASSIGLHTCCAPPKLLISCHTSLCSGCPGFLQCPLLHMSPGSEWPAPFHPKAYPDPLN